MTKSHRLHNEAMEAYDAYMAHFRHDASVGEAHLSRAIALESEAAQILFGKFDLEPTRSRLYLSAASMAHTAGQLEAAERLLASALAGFPPASLRKELLGLFETVGVERHLSMEGISLKGNEMHLILAGGLIGHGFIPKDDFDTRISSLQRALIRTTQANRQIPFNKDVNSSSVGREVSFFYKTPVAASFAITLKVGIQETLDIPGLSTDSVVDDFMKVVSAFASQESEVKVLVPDEQYRETIVQNLRLLAPDGNRVGTVGVASSTVSIKTIPKRERSSKQSTGRSSRDESETIFVGFLRRIDGMHGKDIVQVQKQDGTASDAISVPPTQLDVVTQLYGKRVRVVAFRIRGKYQLHEINLED